MRRAIVLVDTHGLTRKAGRGMRCADLKRRSAHTDKGALWPLPRPFGQTMPAIVTGAGAGTPPGEQVEPAALVLHAYAAECSLLKAAQACES